MNPLIYTKPFFVEYWPSLGDYIRYLEGNEEILEDINGQSRIVPASPSWDEDLGYPGSLRQALIGQNVQREAFHLRDELVRRLRVTRAELPRWDVVGSSVDVGAFNAGVPECMLDFHEDVGRAMKTVSLACAVCASAGVHARSMALRGAAFMAIVDALELSGRYRVNVYAVNCLADHRQYPGFGAVSTKPGYASIIRLKDAAQHYDPHAIGFVLGNGAFDRRLGFATQEIRKRLNPELSWLVDSGYGTPAVLGSMPEQIDTAVIDLTKSLNHDWSTEAQALKWVRKQLETFNILDKADLA